MKKNTRAEITAAVATRTKITRDDVHIVLNNIVDVMSEMIARGETIDLRRFGSFKFKFRAKVVRRNPRSPKELYEIPAHHVVVFKPADELRKLVRKATAIMEPEPEPEAPPVPQP